MHAWSEYDEILCMREFSKKKLPPYMTATPKCMVWFWHWCRSSSINQFYDDYIHSRTAWNSYVLIEHSMVATHSGNSGILCLKRLLYFEGGLLAKYIIGWWIN